MSLSKSTATVVLFTLIEIGIVIAQGPVGTLNGTVQDQTSAVVAGATVVAKNLATAEESTATTTSTGSYTLPYLPAGTYNVRVSSPGFRTATAQNIVLRVAQTLTVDIKLELGAVTDQVVVSTTPELLEAGTAEMGRYINEAEYKSWPVFVDDGQRQIQQFIFDSLPGTTGGTFQGSINGGQQYSHEILIEGMPIGRSDLSGGNNNELSPSAEAIGEFKMQTGAVGAQYNGGQTAVANFTIKSGTNDPHGSAFYYLQNEAFDAQNIQEKTAGTKASRYRLNNWGYSVGGPVYIPKVYHGRNKTFFFTNYEKTKQDDFVASGFATLPVTNFTKGDFSSLFDPAFTGNPRSGTVIGTDASGNPIRYGQIYDPRSTRTLASGATVRDPFPGNIIPQAQWDPVAKNILSNYGYPTPALASMVRNQPAIGTCCPYFDEHIIGVKVDHEVNQNNRISGYYNHSYRNRNNNGGQRYLPIPGQPSNTWTQQTTPGELVRLSLVSTITPSIVNRVAGGYNSFVNQNGTPAAFIGQGYADKLGLKNLPGTIFPKVTFSGAEWQGGTIAQMGAGYSDRSVNGSYILQDDLTWIRGPHSIRFGYEYKRYFYNDRSLSDAGSFTFSPLQTGLPASATGSTVDVNNGTGNAFASFLLGAVKNASHSVVGLSSGFRQPQHAFYVSDDWKLTPRLTLNLGFRWEVIPPLYEVTGRMSEVDLNKPNPEAGNRPGALAFSKQVNDTFWKQFSPRLGIAYRATNKMVVRAGYAILSTPPIANGWGYGGFLYGYNGTVNVPAQGTINNPALYLSNPFPVLAQPLPNTDPSSANFTTASTTARDANRPGYTHNYNLTIQFQLPKEMVLETAYVGNKGTRMWGGTAYNEYDALPASMLSRGSILNEPVSDHPQFLPYAGFPTTNTVAQALRPYPQFYGVQEQFPYNTNSNYNSLQVTVTRHLTTNLGFLAAYTWSKTIGYVDSNGPSGYGTNPQDYFNRGLDRAVATFDQPHNFKLTWVYETPFGKGRRYDLHALNTLLGGWQLSAIHNYASGFPVAVSESGINAPAGFASGIRPDVVSGQSSTVGGIPSHVDTTVASQYLNPAAFTPSPTASDGTPLRVGTAPRNLSNVRAPLNISERVRMSKRFYVGNEKRFFQVGATLSNPFKRTVPYIVDTTVGDSAFGKLLNGGGDRRLQLEARFEF